MRVARYGPPKPRFAERYIQSNHDAWDHIAGSYMPKNAMDFSAD